MAASIHDVGKIKVPAEILSKPGMLDPLEVAVIKQHAKAGFDILKDVHFPFPIAQWLWQHHERLDGSGYSMGVKGDAILLESRILTVADVVEAIYSNRPYRPGRGIHNALDEIASRRGEAYDLASWMPASRCSGSAATACRLDGADIRHARSAAWRNSSAL